MLDTPGLSTKFLKKESYSGSHHGMRYTIKKGDEGLNVYLYAEPWSFESTPKENRIVKTFDFSDDGVAEAIKWLEELHTAHRSFWLKAEKDKMTNMLTGTFLTPPVL